MTVTPRVGLVLTGGGARGAYLAGVLRAIAEIHGLATSPFQVIAGVSAGAINAAMLAAHADDFPKATRRLWELWSNLRTSDVFHTNPLVLSRIGVRLVKQLSFGGSLTGTPSNFLLDTAPLRAHLREHIDSAAIQRNLASGCLYAFAVTATNYHSGSAVTFFDGDDALVPWIRTARISMRERISPEHVLASAALPVFFPPVQIGGSFYGDGCIRLTAPLSSAVHLGADRVLAIGIRYIRPIDGTARLNRETMHPGGPPLAQIAGVLLNSVFLDSLEADLERMARINHTLTHIPSDRRAEQNLRVVPITAVRPSRDLGSLASELFDTFPGSIRHLLRGLGASNATGWDLLSYLAFDKNYTEQLLLLGYEDAMTQRAELEHLLRAEASPSGSLVAAVPAGVTIGLSDR